MEKIRRFFLVSFVIFMLISASVLAAEDSKLLLPWSWRETRESVLKISWQLSRQR